MEMAQNHGRKKLRNKTKLRCGWDHLYQISMLLRAREQARPPLDYPPLNGLIQGNLEIIKRIAVKKLDKESLKHEPGEGRQYLSSCLEFSMH